MEKMDGLLLRGGPDIAPEFLNQPVPDPSILDKDSIRSAIAGNSTQPRMLSHGASQIFAICKGMQLFNVALGGTLRLDITGHNAPEMKDNDLQPLRTANEGRPSL